MLDVLTFCCMRGDKFVVPDTMDIVGTSNEHLLVNRSNDDDSKMTNEDAEVLCFVHQFRCCYTMDICSQRLMVHW